MKSTLEWQAVTLAGQAAALRAVAVGNYRAKRQLARRGLESINRRAEEALTIHRNRIAEK